MNAPIGTRLHGLRHGPAGTRKVMVVSHERSGTHFLMNTLALNFGYVVEPWIDLDYQLGLHFHHPQSLCMFFMSHLHDAPVVNIVKSHHQVGFFAEFLPYLMRQFAIFYIYRDPRDVMASYWRYVRGHAWDEGPRTESVGAFMRAQPRGGMLRYQKDQLPTVLDRWRTHVDGWTVAAAHARPGAITLVRYEDLAARFEPTVRDIGQRLRLACPSPPIRPPSPPGWRDSEGIGRDRALFTREDAAFVHQRVGATMARLGLPWEPPAARAGWPWPRRPARRET